jgi:hypothetical protein
LQCKNLPDFSVTERASTFALLSVDINSLDDHDKIVIGGVQEEQKDRYEDSEGSEESKILDSVRTVDQVPVWTEKMRTEIQSEEENPIYFNSFTFSSSNMAVMRFRVQIYQTAGASVEQVDMEKSTLIGEGEVEIGQLLKQKKTGVVSIL